MRVLLIADWPALEGGTERYVELLREGLEAAGDDVCLMTSSVGSVASSKAEFVARASERRAAQAFLHIANPSAAATAAAAVRRFRPDVVHATTILDYLSPAVLAPLRRVPVTLSVTDFKPICPVGTKLLPDGTQCEVRAGVSCWRNGCVGAGRGARDAVRYGSFRAALGNVNRVLACSRHVRDELRRAGIDSVALYLPIRRPSPGFRRAPASSPRFVYAGRLAPVKGVEVLLRAFARVQGKHRNAHLTIRGDGPLRDELSALSTALGLDDVVRFDIGMARDWEHLLEDCWALVVPSVYREPLGLVAIEALMHRVPVIATEGGGLGETIEDGVTGLLCRNGDEDGLADCLEAICRGGGSPRRVLDPANTRALERRHDLAGHVDELHRIWQSVAA